MKENICLKIIVTVCVCLVLILCTIDTANQIFRMPQMIAENDAANAARAGVIVDKEIINAHSSLFHSNDMQYRIVIEVEYDYKGETKATTKSIFVDKETYLAAEIGMHFDSQSLVVSTVPA